MARSVPNMIRERLASLIQSFLKIQRKKVKPWQNISVDEL